MVEPKKIFGGGKNHEMIRLFMLKKKLFNFAVCSLFIAAATSCLTLACEFRLQGEESLIAQRGYVSGVVRDSAGNPLAGVKIIIDHSIFYNSNISTVTDEAGKYRVKVPTGSWYAFAQYKKKYAGKTYTFYLEPDSYAGFGGEGAVRNFVWKLTGEKQEPLSPGFFGGLITIDKAIGGGIIPDATEIEFTLTPVGTLIDGSKGETLKIRPADQYTLQDIPIGKYSVSASYQGQKLKLRRWNTSERFVPELEIDFEPQIPAQCDNCVKLEYLYNN